MVNAARGRPGAVAIVGMACRLPGAADRRQYWQNLLAGIESLQSFTVEDLLAAGNPPAEVNDPAYVKAGFPLPEPDGFDPAFFGYSPHEARLIDPQQRLLLETAWEAFEDAAIVPGAHLGPVGVYAATGGVVTGYMVNALRHHPLAQGHTASLLHLGNDKDFAATRISYKLDLTGPGMTVQTACSTSLVLLDLACRAIQAGDCALALAAAGAVRVPQVSGYVPERGAVASPDGHVRPFDAEAGGTHFSSGVGAVLLKDLARALADGDPIHAVIRGTALNNDGARKPSYAGTSVRGQAEAMTAAIARAGLTPDDIDAFECHGTGTAVGDPREVSALTLALGKVAKGGRQRPIGSVKGNIGHSEQSAGLSALIKLTLAVQAGVLPPTVNFSRPHPRLKLESAGLFVNAAPLPWPTRPDGGPRRGLVNALGIGGTNGAVVIEQAPPPPSRPATVTRRLHPLPLSGKTPQALAATAARHRAWLAEHPDADVAAVALTLGAGREHFDYRAVLLAGTVTEALAGLETLAVPDQPSRSYRLDRKVGFLFSGQGSQIAGMGRALYALYPVYRQALDDALAATDGLLEPPLRSVLLGDDTATTGLIDQTAYTQPALFAVEYALARLVMSWGITPAAVAGHSVGELAAAVIAGMLPLDAAARLICARAAAMQALPAGGAMAALLCDEATAAALIAAHGDDRLAIAAVNGPAATVISGDGAAVAAVLAACAAQGIGCRRLTVSHAFHSPLMDPALSALRAAAEAAPAAAPAVPWISTATGQAHPAAPDAAYWVAQARGAVRFADAVRAMAAQGITDFVEIGPGRSLLSLGASCLEAGDLAWIPTLRPGDGEERAAAEAVGSLYRRGFAVDWAAFAAGTATGRLSMPAYAFQRERMWIEDLPAPAPSLVPPSEAEPGLPGRRLPLPPPDLHFRSRLSLAGMGWLADHRVHGVAVLPTVAGVAAALAAARRRLGDTPLEAAAVSYAQALVIAEDQPRTGHLSLSPSGQGLAFSLSSRPDDAGAEDETAWARHLEGEIRPGPGLNAASGRFSPDAVRRRCPQPVVPERFYGVVRALGMDYGPAFRGIESLWRGSGEALARLRPPVGSDTAPGGADGLPHPALLDACLHVYFAVVEAHGDFTGPPPPDAVAALPLSVERFAVAPLPADGKPWEELWVHARRRPGGVDGASIIDLEVFDADGRPVVVILGLGVKALPATLFRPAAPPPAAEGWLYRIRWEEAPLPVALSDAAAPRHWLLLGGARDGLAAALAARLEALGGSCRHLPAAPTDRAEVAALLADYPPDAALGVVHLAAPDAGPAGGAEDSPQKAVLGSALALAQGLEDGRDRFAAPPRLWLVTRNAVPAVAAQPPLAVLQAALWGFGRSLALEAPATWGGLIDLEAIPNPEREVPLLAAQLTGGGAETQTALRADRRRVARLVRTVPPPVWPSPDTPGSYLITGGLGALGVETADWLARHRTRPTLVLVSRQGEAAANAAAVRARLEGLGATVIITQADVTDPDGVSALMARLRTQDPPLRGIYHSAGVLDDGMVGGQDWTRFRRALAPKLDAAWLLHQHAQGLPLREFVLYSSVLSVIGSAGQTNYTAANASLDALAAHRRALGQPALSVNWGPWAEAGLADSLGERGEALWRARGMAFLPPSLGQEAFAALFDGDLDQAMVAQVDWPLFLRQFQTPPAFYAHLAAEARAGRDGAGTGGGLADDIGALRAGLAEADPVRRRAAATAFLVRQVTLTLGMGQPAPADRPLRELGLDSLLAVTLINRVETATGLRIPAATLIRGPSIDDLVAELWPDLSAAAAPSHPEAPETATARPQAPRPRPAAGGKWLIPITPRSEPKARVFCFPFAGGGSAAFQTWAAQTDPGIELIAVEPPGRLTRIEETPVSDMGVFVRAVLAEMEPLLDRPFALFGHCLGGLTLFETARVLMADGRATPRHLFCSGARPPDRTRVVGSFERKLILSLAGLRGFKPLQPIHRQPDEVFAAVIRQFDMAATDRFLDDPDLRRLMLPAIRAEFRMTTEYQYQPQPPWDVPITCFISRGDPYVTREDVLGWGRFTNRRLQVFMREGTHYSVFEDAAFIQRTIARELLGDPPR